MRSGGYAGGSSIAPPADVDQGRERSYGFSEGRPVFWSSGPTRPHQLEIASGESLAALIRLRQIFNGGPLAG